MAAHKTRAQSDQEQRDAATRTEITVNEVIRPAIARVEAAVTGLVNKDFMTRAEADSKFLTKSDFRPYAVAFGVVATTVIGAITVAILKGVFK